MRALLLLICIMIWTLIFTVVDAWSLPQRSKRKINTMTRPIPILFYSVDNQHASPTERRRMMNAAITYLRDNGVRANIRRRVELRDVFARDRLTASFGLFEKEFFHYYLSYPRTRNSTNYYMLPPITINGLRYIAGLAWQGSLSRGGHCTSHVQMTNSWGTPRYRHSVVGVIHEILHTLGCGHETSASIMHPSAFVEQDKLEQEGTGRLLPVGVRCKAVIDRMKR